MYTPENEKMDVGEVQQIKKKTVKGVTSLILGGVINSAISLIGNSILTVILTPPNFSIYYLVTAIIGILNYFSDVGLAAALVQKQEELKKEDLATTFTIQQILIACTISVLFFLSSSIAQFFNMGENGLWLFRALLISFFLSSLKTIPSVILERNLKFGLKVIPLILETLTFYVVAIFLAQKSYGVLSWAYAAIARSVVGLIAIYILSPWKISIGFHKDSAKKLLSFGIPLQGGSILALIKDDFLTIFLGKILPPGSGELGYIGWAKKWSEYPLRLVMDNIVVVSFPVYSRIAHDKEVLRRGIEKALFFASFLIFPMIICVVLFADPLAHFIPHNYYAKWNKAFISLYLFSFSALMSSLSSPLVQALNAIGKAKTTFKLMLFWTILAWLIIPTMVFHIGFNGVALSASIISLTGFLPVLIMRRFVSFSLFQSIHKPFIATLVMVGITSSILLAFGSFLWGIILAGIVGIGTYAVIMYLWAKDDIRPYIQLLVHRKP